MKRTTGIVRPLFMLAVFVGCSDEYDTGSPKSNESKSPNVKRAPPTKNPAAPGESESKEKGQKAPDKIVVSKETTYLEGPLNDDGTVSYVAAFNQLSSKGVTAKTNAAVWYRQAFGPSEIPAKHREQFFKLLGIAIPPLEGEYFINLDDYLRREKSRLSYDAAYDLLPKLRSRPWSVTEHAEIAAWLKANRKAFELLVEGSKRPRYYAPLVGDSLAKSVTILTASAMRDAMRGLSARAMLRLKEENADAAWDDLSTCLRIARHYAQHGSSVVELMLGISFAAIADESCRAMASYADVPADLQRRINRELLGLGSFGISDSARVFERCMILEWLTGLLLHDKPRPGGDFAMFPELVRLGDPVRPLDANEGLRVINGYFDRVGRIESTEDYSSQVVACAELAEQSEKQFAGDNRVNLLQDTARVVELILSGETPKVRGARAGAMMFNLVSGTRQPLINACRRGNDNRHLTRLTFGVAAYRSETGHYPDSLAKLTPKLVSIVGKSAFTGEDFYYRKLGPSFVLAAAGPQQSRNLPEIEREIGVSYDCRASHEAMQQLSAAGWEVRDYEVRSRSAAVNDGHLRLVARIPTVERVWIGGFEVTNDGLRPLAALPRLADLAIFAPAHVTSEGLRHLEDSRRLKYLSISHPSISDAEMRPISKMANLRYLSLSRSSITDAGLASVVRLPKLEVLLLDRTGITDEGLKHLAKARQLTRLSVQQTGISADAIQHFKQSVPDCEVIQGPLP